MLHKQYQQGNTFLPFLALIAIAILVTANLWLYFNVQKESTLPQPIATRLTATTTDEMSDWQTYRNEKLYYQIQIPTDWWINEQKDFTQILPPSIKKENLPLGAGYGGAKNNKPVITISSVGDLTVGETVESIGDERKIVINNLTSIQRQENGSFGNSINTYLPKGKSYIKFSWDLISTPSDPTLDQILSTFRFTDEMSDWKTYSEKNANYTFKYPFDWKISNFDPQFISLIPSGVTGPRETYQSKIMVEYFPYPLPSNDGKIVSRDEAIFTLTDKKEITINGSKATQGIKGGVPNLLVTQIVNTDKIYQIYWPVVNAYPELFQQILSTFRFTDTTPAYTYSVVQFTNNTVTPGISDTKLVRSDNTVIIPSLRAASGTYLAAFSLPTQGDQLYFRSALPESDNAAGQIYSYSLTQKKFTKLKNLNSLFSGWGSVKINPNGYIIAFVRDTYFENPVAGLDQKLYIFDLSQDKLIKTITLSGTETFNSGYGALSSDYYLTWIDQNTLEYKVYKNSVPEKKKEVLRTQQYTLQN